MSETTLTGSDRGSSGIFYWTAGQRVDPSTESTFVWRVTSMTNTSSDTVSAMSYTNWNTTQPNYANGNDACMDILSDESYTWNDYPCSYRMCSVCEMDI